MPLKPHFAALLLAAAAMAAGSAHAADDVELLQSLDACIVDAVAREEAEAEEDLAADPAPPAAGADDADEPELSELETYCPEVYAALDESRLAPFLEPDWAERISASKLERLRSLLVEPPKPAGRALDTASLAQIAERVRTSGAERERSLWQRFKDWVRRLLEAQKNTGDRAWFEDWIREHWPSERVTKIIAYGILAALVGGLAWIVWTELRAAGVLGRRRRRGDAPAAVVPANGQPRRPRSLAEASDAELPGLLVDLVLEQLRRLGRVQDRRSMTHRELRHAVRFDAVEEGEVFRDLLGLSERVRYASAPPPPPAANAIVGGARRLLEGLTRQAVRTT